MAPSRLKLTITVMSIGLAREAGGGCQHESNLAKTSLMVSSCCGWACACTADASHTRAAANQTDGLLRAEIMASLDVGCDLYLHHLVWIGNRFATLDLVDHIHARHHFADYGVLPVQRRAFREHDEELRIGGIVACRARHPDDAALERHVGEFGRQVRIFRTAGAVEILAVAGLRHESLDHAMERHVVVVTLTPQQLYALGMLGR